MKIFLMVGYIFIISNNPPSKEKGNMHVYNHEKGNMHVCNHKKRKLL